MPSQPNVSKAALNKIWLTAGLIAGCAAPQAKQTPGPVTPQPARPTTVAATQAAPVDEPIAAVGTTHVGRMELNNALAEAYGFNMLMLLVQRDMARDACAQQNIKVTDADVKWEYDWTVGQMFPNLNPGDDREKLLDQYLAQPKPAGQTATRAELAIIIETNACFRKLVEPTVNRAVTEPMLQQQFDEEYGAKVRVRDIVVANPQDAADVRRRLDAGEDFAAVARQISRDPSTKRNGGELPPFNLNDTRLPANFKRVAFDLKPDEVSDPVQASGGYHLIKLEERVAPKAVKFEDVKASLREDYESKLVLEGVKAVRGRLAQQALAQLKITDPILKAEFDKRLAARDQLIRDREKIKDQMERDRIKAETPTTTPVVPPPATAPAASGAASAPTTTPVAPPPAMSKPASQPTPLPSPVLTPATTPAPVQPTPKQPAAAPSPTTRPAATTHAAAQSDPVVGRRPIIVVGGDSTTALPLLTNRP